MPVPTESRGVLEVDASAVIHNLSLLSERNGHAKILAVCKGDFYGCGKSLYPLIADKIDALGVATVEEGICLRKICSKPILVFGYVSENQYLAATQNDLSLSIYAESVFSSLKRFAEAYNVRPKIHLKINTGMNRFGLRVDDVKTIRDLIGEKAFTVEGIYTHFATENDAFYRLQRARFRNLVDHLASQGFSFPFIHASNTSAALFGKPIGNAIRVGYGMYGFVKGLTPAVRVLGRVVQLRTIEKDEGVGYGLAYRPDRQSVIATVSVGYADGYPRDRSNVGRVLFRGAYLPVIGRVCMDCLFVDVTDKKVCEGDYVTLLGAEGDKMISLDELGFGYEVLCRFHALRGERRYLP